MALWQRFILQKILSHIVSKTGKSEQFEPHHGKTMWFLNRTVTNRVVQTQKHKQGVDWRSDTVVDSGPRGPGFNPQPGCLSLWP